MEEGREGMRKGRPARVTRMRLQAEGEGQKEAMMLTGCSQSSCVGENKYSKLCLGQRDTLSASYFPRTP